MNWKRIVGIIIVLTFVVGFGIIYAQNNAPRNIERWEYLLVSVSNLATFGQRANEAGQEGWELIMVLSGEAVFKRRLP